MPIRLRTFLLGVVSLVAVGVGLCACRSLSKEEVEERLLALPKNAEFRAAGIERRRMTIRRTANGVAGAADATNPATTDAEITFVHVPARSGLPGARRPVVLVHGTPSSLFTWNDVVFGKDGAPGLAAEFDVYVLDVVGHGITRTEPDDPLTFQSCADWIAGAIEGLGIGPVHLVGNSYGGEFCWRAAVDRPDLVRTLTLIDSSGRRRPDDGWLPEEVKMREMSLARIGWLLATRENIRGALQPHFPFPVTDDQIDECYAICRNPSNWRGMVDLARDENGTREAEIAKLSMPTLLLWGADDVAYPPARDAGRFAAAIRTSELHVFPRCGHYPQETVPGEVVARIRAFASSHDR